MIESKIAALVGGALLLMLGALFGAKALLAKPAVTVSVTIKRVNGDKVTYESGRVIAWKLGGGRMSLEYVPDPVAKADHEPQD